MGGMTKIPSYSQRDGLANVIGELVQQSLADGVHPADLSAALTVAAIRVGLQYAPNAGIAFAVVMKTAGDVAAEWVTAAKPRDQRDVQWAPIGTTIH
jgi:hypothetical protein